MISIFSSPFFSLALCIFCYAIGLWINKKTKWTLLNPLLIAILLVIAVLLLLKIPYDAFAVGGDFIALFLAPATTVMAVSIYHQFDTLKKNWLPVLSGILVGSVVSIGTVFLLSRLFLLDETITHSFLPKSSTTAIAIEISRQSGGIEPITIAAVLLTGILGAILAPLLIKLFRIKDPIAIGVGLGTCSHSIGTSKAFELGEVEGSMSSIALGITGIFTVLLITIFF